jgi:ubiquinone/menaquinone biosynthesis C-methylase UbiE
MRAKVIEYFQDSSKSLKQESVVHRAFMAIYLFDFLDRLKEEKFPSDWFDRMRKEMDGINSLAAILSTHFDNASDGNNTWKEDEIIQAIDYKTGNVYFQLWQNFTKNEYYQEPKELLKYRLSRNSLKISEFQNGLDAGCGGGRYTLALRSMGIKRMQGVDISPDSISLASKMSGFSENEVSFQQASVLDLPFDDESFDFVFSNGVLHHTTSTTKGLSELYRVLQPGGEGWLYLYGGKESLFWDIVDFCRKILSDVPQSYMQILMKVLGYPPGRIFHRVDFWYVPIHNRYFSSEVAMMLDDAGFSSHRRLLRGADIDWDEIIHNNKEIDPYIYGEGEMRFWITK